MPGYCRDIIGQTPFGWSLDDAMEGLGPRVAQAEQVLALAGRTSRSWAAFPAGGARPPARQARPRRPVLGRGRWQAAAGRRLRAAADRAAAFTVLSTVGMCCQRMPVVEQTGRDVGGAGQDRAGHRDHDAEHRRRPHLPVARPVPVAGRDLARARPQPAAGTTSPPPSRSAAGNEAVLLLDEPGRAAGPGGARALRLHVRRRAGAVAVGGPDQRAGAPAGPGARVREPGHAARGAAPQLGRRAEPAARLPAPAWLLAAAGPEPLSRLTCCAGRRPSSSSQTTGATTSSESIRSMTPPCPGSTVAHVLDLQVPLDHRLGQVAEGGRGDGRGAQDDALPDVAVQQPRQQDRAAGEADEHRPGEALPGLLRADRRGHRVPAEEDPGEIAADVAADR